MRGAIVQSPSMRSDAKQDACERGAFAAGSTRFVDPPILGKSSRLYREEFPGFGRGFAAMQHGVARRLSRSITVNFQRRRITRTLREHRPGLPAVHRARRHFRSASCWDWR
jgi:hypothetical protein